MDGTEETSNPNLINNNEWVNIHLKIVALNTLSDENCSFYNENDKMRLYIYINGYLKLISKELPMLHLKSLNDNSERQEGVPYNISVGGGS